MAFPKWPFKDPNEILDYVVEWEDRLAPDDAISDSDWIVSTITDDPSPLVKDSEGFSPGDATATIWLSAGTIGNTYEITNRIVTVDGRTMDQTTKLQIKAK